MKHPSDSILSAAVRRGATECDIFIERKNYFSVSILGKEIEYIKKVEEAGAAVRVFKKGAMGFAYTSSAEHAPLERCAASALDICAAASPIKDFVGLPSGEKPAKKVSAFDEKLSRISEKAVCKLASDLLALPDGVKESYSLRGEIEIVTDLEKSLVNSNGVKWTTHETRVDVYFSIKLEQSAENVATGFEIISGRKLSDIDIESLRPAIEMARRGLNSEKAKTDKYTIVLSPFGTLSLVEALEGALNGVRFAENSTFLKGLEGKQCASAAVNLISDPTIPFGTRSFASDDEGNAARKVEVIAGGKLANVFHDTYSASMTGSKPNGNARRANYKTPPSPGCGNMVLTTGKRKSADIISGIKRGILIDSFPQINAVNGVYSSMIDFGWMIEGGKPGRAVKGSMMGGNLLDSLKKVKEVSSDCRDFGGSRMPFVVIEDVSISSE